MPKFLIRFLNLGEDLFQVKATGISDSDMLRTMVVTHNELLPKFWVTILPVLLFQVQKSCRTVNNPLITPNSCDYWTQTLLSSATTESSSVAAGQAYAE